MAKTGDCKLATDTVTNKWVKRDAETGRFIDVKEDGEPFKGVRREHPDKACH